MVRFRNHCIRNYEDFLRKSPGIDVPGGCEQGK